MKIESVLSNMYFDAEAEISIDYQVFPKRIEECHGYHEFDEDEEKQRKLISFKILLDTGEELDIASVLTEEMKSKILACV
jgi:hypothetical protein